MANLKTIQFLRNATLYNSLELAKSGLTEQADNKLDGSPLIGRYLAGEEERSILGLVHVSGSTTGVTFFMNEKEFDNILDGLDYSGITTSDAAVVTNVTEANGMISATSENVGNLILTDYSKGSDSGAVAATDSINAAVAKLENQIDAEEAARIAAINALDYTGYTLGDSEVFATITEENGVIAATGKNLSGVKLDGYTVGGDDSGKVAATDTLGEALGKLQGQINGMDKAADAVAGQVVTTVSEADGVVSETKANVKDLQLGGYAKTNDTGAIASADTINVALSKLENKAAAITIGNADGSINVTTAASGTDIAVNIKSGEKVIMLDGEGNGIYTDIKLSGITPSSTNVREEYALIASDGLTQLGSSIKVYKDSSLTNIYIGHIDDALTNADSSGESPDTAVTNGTGDTALVYIMHLENDKYKLAAVNVEAFLEETEFGSGVTATNHVVHGVVDPTSESFLTVGADGFKVAGISGFVQSEIGKLDATVGDASVQSGKHVAVQVVEADGVITTVTVSEADIASASALTAEETARANADTALSDRLGTGVTSANTATAQFAALSGNGSSTSAETSVEGAKRYADAKLDNVVGGLDADVSGNSTHVTVNVVEADGVITDVNVDESNIANADDLATLSAKTVTEIGSSNSSIAVSTSTTTAADGTVKYDVITDTSKIKLSGYTESSATTEQAPANGDTISEALSKIYATAKHHHASGSSAIDVTTDTSGSTISLILDDSSALSTNNNDENVNNALMITSDGLFLSKDWDCGTF